VANERVLVVEDEAVIREALCHVLTGAGYDATGVSDGEAAVRLLGSEDVDLVITDIRLPGLDGLGVARHVRTSCEDVPVIILTGYPDVRTAVEAVREGVYDYLAKPFDIDRLRMVVAGALEKRRLARENRRLVEELRSANEELEGYRRDLEMRVAEVNRDLVETSQRLLSVVQNIPSGIASISADGQLRSLNPAAERILGCAQEWAQGRPVEEVFAKAEANKTGVGEAVRAGRNVPYGEAVLTVGEGRRVQLAFGVAQLTADDGGPGGAVVIFQDVTEQTRERERRLRLEKMEALDGLSHAVAHEIKNPLAGLRTAAELLEGQIEEGDSRRKLASMIMHQTDRLTRILDGLSEFSRPARVEVEEADLADVVNRVLELIEPQARSRGLELRREVKPGLAARLDQDGIEQVILNAALNAMDAMDGRGTLSVRAAPSGGDAKMIEVLVEDTGRGISEDDLPNVFKPFFTTKAEGTGLGLSVSQRIVESHNGEMSIASRPGKGTAVSIRIPAATLRGGKE